MTAFHVDADHLRGHAGHLEATSSAVDTAKEAGDTVDLDIHAFGVMNAELIPWAKSHQSTSMSMVNALAEAFRKSAEGMRGMATDYDGADAAAEARFRAFDAALGVTP